MAPARSTAAGLHILLSQALRSSALYWISKEFYARIREDGAADNRHMIYFCPVQRGHMCYTIDPYKEAIFDYDICPGMRRISLWNGEWR
jgi:hypothetical protein